MQTPEGIPDSLQRVVRGEHTGPTELEDLLPGSDSGDTLPGSTPSLPMIRRELDEAENVAADIELHTRQAIREQISEAAKGVEAIKANLQGHIGNELDAADKVVSKLSDKIATRIANGLTNAYADAVRLGFDVPTIDQVQYGIATGDYLGSVIGPGSGRDESEHFEVKPLPQGGYTDDDTDEHFDIRPLPPGERRDDGYKQPPMDKGDGTGRPVIPPVVVPQPPSGPWSRPNLGGGTYVLCQDPASGHIVKVEGQSCPVGWRLACWDNEGNGVPGHISRDNTIEGCRILSIPEPPVTGPPTQPPQTQPPLPQCPVCEACPPDYNYFDWDGISPLPPNAVRVGDRICIPHPGQYAEMCPIEIDPTCGTPAKFPDIAAKPATDNYCRDLEDWLNENLANVPTIEQLLKTRFSGIGDSAIARQIAKAITGTDKPVVASLIDSFGKWLGEAAKSVVFSSSCDKVQLAPIASVNAIIKFLNQWFGIVPRAATQTLQQAENLVCQTVMPDQPSTDKAYLADEISKDLWRCWTELNGSVVEAAKIGPETLRTRPTSEQVSKLFRRQMITEDDFKTRMRQNGVLHDKDRQAIHDLTQDWPSLSDLTPMLVRDVWDEKTIDWTEVDRLFEDKYTDETKKYFDAIGLTKDVVKYYWRAHFHLPSFTMVSEMYHRFRHLPEGDPLKTDLEKVKKLLIQDDWHPDWIDRMLAITFRPMRLIDIRTAYDMRILDDEGLKDKLRILGYSDADVDVTFAQWQRRRDIRDAKQGGFPSVQKLVTQYANCEIDDHTFRYQLSFVVESEQQEQKAVEAAQIARQSESNRRTIAGVSWQYRRGLITEDEASSQLAQQGIDPTCIPSLVRVWKSQAAKQPKQLTAASLCKMLEQGIISQGDFVTALIRIGYTAIDAQRIVQSCSIGLTQKEIRQANREANRLTRERKAADREAARLQRLAECGPPPCPKNRQIGSHNGEVGP